MQSRKIIYISALHFSIFVFVVFLYSSISLFFDFTIFLLLYFWTFRFSISLFLYFPFSVLNDLSCATYNVILNTVPEAGSWGRYWVYTGLRGVAWGELPASGTVLRIILYNDCGFVYTLFNIKIKQLVVCICDLRDSFYEPAIKYLKIKLKCNTICWGYHLFLRTVGWKLNPEDFLQSNKIRT